MNCACCVHRPPMVGTVHGLCTDHSCPELSPLCALTTRVPNCPAVCALTTRVLMACPEYSYLWCP
ncbi:unnamed protein product [Staurois parvus]|uniref:Uncharacterized protein n=1 Tax=Staurois parvus TaxID=386267 RepID=A0ABN9AMD7_9NEOB|nr:unnamed protein product [Staurois parvus]